MAADSPGLILRLFNPRIDDWSEHFEFVGPHIVGRTAIGKATARLLDMNTPEKLRLRSIIGNPKVE